MTSRVTLPRLYLRLPNGEFVEIEEEDALIILRADGTEEVFMPTGDDLTGEEEVSVAGAKAAACLQLLSDPVALVDAMDGLDLVCEFVDDDDADQR